MQKPTASSVEKDSDTQSPQKNLTPAEAKARLGASRKRFNAVLDGVNQPLAIGIHHQLRDALPDMPAKHFQHCIWRLTTSHNYLKATIKASCRYDLQNVESELTDTDKHLAQKKLDALRVRKRPPKPSQSASDAIVKPKPEVKPQKQPDIEKQQAKPKPKITVKRRRTLSLSGDKS